METVVRCLHCEQ